MNPFLFLILFIPPPPPLSPFLWAMQVSREWWSPGSGWTAILFFDIMESIEEEAKGSDKVFF